MGIESNLDERTMSELQLATPTHRQAHDLVCDYLQQDKRVLALALTGSAARNEGSFDSDLDYAIFFREDAPTEEIIERVNVALDREIHARQGDEVGLFFAVDLHAVPTLIVPQPRSWTDGPDNFELEIGNTFVHTRLIFERGDAFSKARARYLPYYDDAMRRARLSATLRFCLNNLDHIEPYVKRGLYFQAFRRLYDASLEFLQALFITKRVYPIAYDKWVKKQLVEMLRLPELYSGFVQLYQVRALESDELVEKSEQLRGYVAKYVGETEMLD
jgi:predicted nucleotidyltransferase